MSEKPLLIKQKPIEELNQYQESLLKKRKRDDVDHRRRVDARAKQKMNQVRDKKVAEKLASGKGILMPEVFVSNHMKQQRNFVHYKRNKNLMGRGEEAAKISGGDCFDAITRPD